MDNKIKNALGSVHAEDTLKQNTKVFLKEKLYQEKKSFTNKQHIQSKKLVSVAACLAVFLMGGFLMYFQPVSAISIDINPSIELSINRFDKVISVKGYNEDGIWLAERINVHFMDYNEAVDTILKDKIVEGYLQREEQMEVTVMGNNDIKSQEMLIRINGCVEEHQHKNIHCYTGNRERAKEAHEHGLSFGKYQKFLNLQELNPSITVEDVKGLTMHEMNQWIWELSQDTELMMPEENGLENGSSGNGVGKASGNGHHGHGEGHN